MKKGIDLPKFNKQKLFEQVFIHRSYINESVENISSNERLEFLGDSILSFVVSSYIYNKYPDLKEGELTNLRSALTNTEILAIFAEKLDLGTRLKLSKGEEESGGRNNKTILANTFEALIGGIYIDQGIDEASKFIAQNIFPSIDLIMPQELKDAKSKLQELLQAKYKVSPIYKIIKEEGPDHMKKYSIGVYLRERLLAQGEGKSKQEAEKQAAKNALKSLK